MALVMLLCFVTDILYVRQLFGASYAGCHQSYLKNTLFLKVLHTITSEITPLVTNVFLRKC
jgi:hypothetical protein